jgi:hypothetical protein
MSRYRFTLDAENKVSAVHDTETGRDVSFPQMRQDTAPMMPATRPNNVLRSAAEVRLRLGIPAPPQPVQRAAAPMPIHTHSAARQDAAQAGSGHTGPVTSAAELRRRLGL